MGIMASVIPLVAMNTINADNPNILSQKLSEVLLVQGIGSLISSKVVSAVYTKYGKRSTGNFLAIFNIIYPILIYTT